MGKDIRIDWDPVKFINGYLKQKIGFKYFSFLHLLFPACAIVVAVTRSPGLNQELERARGALPTTMLDIPLSMEQM